MSRLQSQGLPAKTPKALRLALVLVVLAAACGFLLRPACAGQIFQWRDETGARHFSDNPPPDFPATLLGEKPPEKPPSGLLSPGLDGDLERGVSSEAKGVFWRIEKSGGRPSFLLGTIHVEDERVLKLPPAAEAAFKAADALVLELVLDEVAIFKAAASMLYMDGTDLKAVLGEALFNRAARAMSTYGVPEFALKKMKPWAVLSTLIVPKPKTGNFLDIMLYRRAVESGKKVLGLETVEEQVHALESLSLEDQIEILRQTLDQVDLLPRMYAAMIETYLAGDLAGLVALSEKSINPQDKALVNRFMWRLNDARNLKMVERLKPYLDQGNVFAAVGALHLPGEKGILRLLEQRGFEASPVR